MTTIKVLFLFPDTNLFVQCIPLEQIDWTAWKGFDEIHVLVSRPVQREIDHQKNRGKDRLGKKARAASSFFREIITGSDDHKEVASTGPKVRVYLRPDLKTDQSLADRLDYSERDDQLVGIAHGFMSANPDADVRLLTHDTGPMASAQMVGFPVLPIPDTWLLPPETSEAERRTGSLEREVARLRKAEPQFEVVCLDAHDNAVDKLELEVTRFEAISSAELEELVTQIAQRYPQVTDLRGDAEGERPIATPGLQIAPFKQVLVPPTEEEIEKYRNESYPRWIASCKTFLRDYHLTQQTLAGQPAFTFVIANDGSRPAKDALVTFTARGDFSIKPPFRRDEDAREKNLSKRLPSPPSPPSAKWKISIPHLALGLGALDVFQGTYRSSIHPQLDISDRFSALPRTFKVSAALVTP